MIKKVFVGIIAACLSLPLAAQESSSKDENPIESYYQKCLSVIGHPEVLKMLDTLYDMSEKASDERMMLVARSNRIDHFYYTRDEDSVKANVFRTQALAKAKGESVYYYFAYSRLVTWYISTRNFEMALNEVENMQNEAYTYDDGYGVMLSKMLMGDLFSAWDRKEESLNYYLDAVETVKDMKLDSKYLFHNYYCIAYKYLSLGKYQEALTAADNAREVIHDDEQRFQLYITYADIYIVWEKAGETKAYLDSIDMVGIKTPAEVHAYNTCKMKYYVITGNSEEALNLCNRLLRSAYTDSQKTELLHQKFQCEKDLGRSDDAVNSLARYYSFKDSILQSDFSQELSAKAVQFELKEAQEKNRQLELQIKSRWLIITQIMIVILIVLFIIVILYLKYIKNLIVKLRKSEKIKSFFFQNLSHEIRTPLNSIMGFSQVLATTPDLEYPEIKRCLQIIFNNSKMVIKLYEDALDASGVERCRDLSVVDINQCCYEIVESVRSSVHEGVELIFSPVKGDTSHCIDKIAVSKVAINLLYNAAKVTTSGQIEFKTGYLSPNKFMISVTDTGPVISADQWDKIFEIFYSIDDSSPRSMGLAISKMYAESINGNIQLDDTYKSGTRIILSFPLKEK